MTVLSLATKRSWKNRENAAWESQTTWHRCVCFGAVAWWAAGLAKGSHVQIVGEIQNRGYAGKDGVKKSVTEIRVQRLVRLDGAAKATEPPRRPPRKRLLQQRRAPKATSRQSG